MNGWKALGFETYKDYLDSNIWRSKRDFIILDRKRCEKCFTTKELCVHHKNYENVGNESGKDLIVLCFKCHKEEHNDKPIN